MSIKMSELIDRLLCENFYENKYRSVIEENASLQTLIASINQINNPQELTQIITAAAHKLSVVLGGGSDGGGRFVLLPDPHSDEYGQLN